MQKTNCSNIELLAPAGSYESFIAAINAGADAVYMGLKNFNARVMTSNFEIDEYIKAIDYAHKRNVKVYLTLNTLLKDSEISNAVESVYKLYKVGLDGVIVQDLGIAHLLHNLMPELSLHASTQMSICTLEQVKMLEQLGFERVVLARELSIEEIKEISSKTKLEIEVFVHGALCVSVSGQCLMSAMIGNRSANRGNCAGPCRKVYSLYNTSGKLVAKNKYLLSKKDIFGLEQLQELVAARVTSLKIEGRNKTPEYVAGVVKNYREALDKGYNKNKEHEVLQLFNRSGKSDGYLKGVRYRNSISEHSPKNTGIYLGKVLDVKNKYIKVKLEQDINLHDGIEIIGSKVISTIVTCIRDNKFNIKNTTIDSGTVVWLGDINKAKIGEDIYKTSDNRLNTKLWDYTKENLKKILLDVQVIVRKNENVKAICEGVETTIDYIPQISKTSSLDQDKVKEAFSKTEETSVRFNVASDIQEGLFVPTSKLNELRKLVVEKVESNKIIRRQITDFNTKLQKQLNISKDNEKKIRENIKQDSLYIYKYNKDVDYLSYYENKYVNKLDVLYVTATDFKANTQDILKYVKKCKVYFVIPNVTFKNMTKYIIEELENLCKKGISGVLIGNIGFIPLCIKLKEKYKIDIVADYSLNIMNKYTANTLKQLGIDKVTPLFENEDIDLDAINKVIPIEIVQDMATVMTTRYCVIASFVKNITKKGECNAECMKNNYYLLDEHNKRYDILTDNMDCITKYVRNKKQYSVDQEKIYSTRHCVLK